MSEGACVTYRMTHEETGCNRSGLWHCKSWFSTKFSFVISGCFSERWARTKAGCNFIPSRITTLLGRRYLRGRGLSIDKAQVLGAVTMAPLCRLSARSNADVSRPVASAALQKRAVAFGLSALLSICSAGLPSAPADAALLQLPATETNNRYFLVRAGASAAENDRGVMLSNPVAKTSMDSGLSTPGKQVVIQETYPALKKLRACEDGCWIWPSITQRSYQTAEILAALFRVGRSNIVPEYSFLDQRGAGAWEGGRLVDVEHLLSDLDSGGADLRPPPGVHR